MAKFKISTDYSEGEDGAVTTLFNEENTEIVSGDYYHDKINDKIDGFFIALDYLGIEYEIENERLNEE